MKKVYFVDPNQTCEVSNFLRSKAALQLQRSGYEPCGNVADSDVIFVNTCAFTQREQRGAEDAVEVLLEERSASNPDARLVVFGCLPGISKRYRHDERVISIGPKELHTLGDHLGAKARDDAPSVVDVNRLGIHSDQEYFQKHRRSIYVPIAQGCSQSCTYCSIKRAKGKPVSEPVERVLRDVGEAVASGYARVSLLADDCASYGADLGLELPDLLDAIGEAHPDVKLNILYYFPRSFVDHLDRLRPHFAAKRLAYVNVPIQSGSDRILGLMKRPYTAQEVVDAVAEVRRVAPAAWLMTHVIFGFPTETEAELLASRDAARHFDEVLFLRYSDNTSTPASHLSPKISDEVTAERGALLTRFLDEERRRGTVVMDTR